MTIEARLSGISGGTTNRYDAEVQVRQHTSWQEALMLGFIHTTYEAHELTHGVTVVVGGPEGMLGYCPSGWEDDKVSNGGT